MDAVTLLAINYVAGFPKILQPHNVIQPYMNTTQHNLNYHLVAS